MRITIAIEEDETVERAREIRGYLRPLDDVHVEIVAQVEDDMVLTRTSRKKRR